MFVSIIPAIGVVDVWIDEAVVAAVVGPGNAVYQFTQRTCILLAALDRLQNRFVCHTNPNELNALRVAIFHRSSPYLPIR